MYKEIREKLLTINSKIIKLKDFITANSGIVWHLPVLTLHLYSSEAFQFLSHNTGAWPHSNGYINPFNTRLSQHCVYKKALWAHFNKPTNDFYFFHRVYSYGTSSSPFCNFSSLAVTTSPCSSYTIYHGPLSRPVHTIWGL